MNQQNKRERETDLALAAGAVAAAAARFASSGHRIGVDEIKKREVLASFSLSRFLFVYSRSEHVLEWSRAVQLEIGSDRERGCDERERAGEMSFCCSARKKKSKDFVTTEGKKKKQG